MSTGTIYDTTKHAFEGLPTTSSICRYCERWFTDPIHQRPSPESGERWITLEESQGPSDSRPAT